MVEQLVARQGKAVTELHGLLADSQSQTRQALEAVAHVQAAHGTLLRRLRRARRRARKAEQEVGELRSGSLLSRLRGARTR